MRYSITDRYDLYSTPEECAAVAAIRFARQQWKWKRPEQTQGRVPTEVEILESLVRLKESGSHEVESGRLAFYWSRFGVQKPRQPHVLISRTAADEEER